MLQGLQQWFASSHGQRVKYMAVSTGFHPYEESNGEFLPQRDAAPALYVPDSDRRETRWIVTDETSMPGWSTILDMYPELTQDPALDKKKLGNDFDQEESYGIGC